MSSSQTNQPELAEQLYDGFNNSNQAITISEIQGDRALIYVNKAFLDETQYSYEEVIGKNCRFLQGAETDESTVEKIRAALENFESIEVDILNYRKDGSSFLNRLKLSTIFDGNGEPSAFLGIQSNVDNLVANERAIQEKYRMESLGRFSANISHEIKNAILPVRLMLDHLKDIDLSSIEQVKKSVAIASDNLDVAENIVRDVLRFSQENVWEKETISIRELTHSVLRFIRNLSTAKVSISENIEPSIENNEHESIVVSKNGVYQIFANLVGNAIDAMQGDGDIMFSASQLKIAADNKKQLNAGTYLSLSIEDDGDGIPEEVIDRIFDPFFSTKSPSEGTGLGLSTSIKIAKDHSGTLFCSNRDTNGAKFTLLLPLS